MSHLFPAFLAALSGVIIGLVIIGLCAMLGIFTGPVLAGALLGLLVLLPMFTGLGYLSLRFS